MMETVRTWPYSTESFIQLDAFANYTLEQWDLHAGHLQKVGFDTIIIQWSCTSKKNQLVSAFYPCKLDQYKSGDYKETNVMEKLMTVCQKRGMHLRIGLNNPDEWFRVVFNDIPWYRKEAEIGVAVAKDIYDQYYRRFPGVICGWYFVPEYFSGMENDVCATELLNLYLDGLNALDPSISMMLSPFLRAFVSPEKVRNEWIRIFKNAHFRSGDIFCCQDSVGAGWIAMFQMEEYFIALREAVDTKPGLLFWANNEDFTQDGRTAPLDRFAKQMAISQKYVEGYVTFAYCHYWAPDYVSPKFHQQYLSYFNIGKWDVAKENKKASTDGMTLISKGCQYSGAANTRGDAYDDDGTKLTSGIIPPADGNSHAYFATSCHRPEFILDLGKDQSIDAFRYVVTFGNWGVAIPAKVIYSVSDDGKHWSEAGEVESYMLRPVAQTESRWFQMDFALELPEPMHGRYIRYQVMGGGFLWLGQLCAYSKNTENC